MPETQREAVVTGIGIVSCLGEGPDSHWRKLMGAEPQADTTTFAPFIVHPLAPIDLDKQIPKRGDQRQMEPWQRIGTYAAGLALDSAGVKGRTEILSRMDMIVAAGGGERDLAADTAVLAGLPQATDPSAFLNERLMSDLRPTLFLAQLSNLLAGNISIVHGVTGSSRTFMGEEAAGIDAVRIALARIRAGQSDIVLVGGAHNGERKDLLMLYEFGHHNLKGDYAPVWDRGPVGGFAIGSLGAFLVLEAKDHAVARGARADIRLTQVLSDSAKDRPDGITTSLERMWDTLAPQFHGNGLAILSGATGAEPATAKERTFLSAHSDIPVRATGSYVGHGLEAQFPLNLALAAVALDHAKLFPPTGGADIERQMEGPLSQVVVTGVGHWRGEGMALIERIEGATHA